MTLQPINIQRLEQHSIFDLSQRVFHADILTALFQMVANHLNHTWYLRPEQFINCLTQLYQDQLCLHLPLMDTSSIYLHLQDPPCCDIEGLFSIHHIASVGQRNNLRMVGVLSELWGNSWCARLQIFFASCLRYDEFIIFLTKLKFYHL